MKYKNLTNSMLLVLLTFTLVLTPTTSQAIVINDVANDGVTTAQITAALQGAGVTISNMVIVNNGCANRTQAVGLFSQGTTPTGPGPVLGDPSGVVLSTGPLKPADPMVSPNNQTNWTNTLCGNVTDADMMLLESQTSNGEYIAIEFDIIPTLPIMTIPFQFGSDEFPEYVCTAYNDVTGIFVSGPGIKGPYSNNAENFAKTPGGDRTSINWVNTGVIGVNGTAARCGSLSNSAYYTDNSNGNLNGGNATVATTNSNLELDGWTNYIYQSINVVPGQSYHVKAAIADAGDRLWDSAVFFHLIFSSGTMPGFDFGDAPDSYRTLTASGGPRHGISNNIFLGAILPDNEVTGQPTATADGDDTTDTDDEDGVGSFPPLSTTDSSYSVDVTVNNTTGSSAQLLGWIDFNGNGVFDNAEGTSLNVPTGTVNGSTTLTWSGLSGLPGGTTYARFRLTTDAAITTATPGGTATNGEVEDYTLEITIPPNVTLVKMAQNIGTTGYDIPGEIVRYTLIVNNFDSRAIDNDTIILTDPVPANTDLVVTEPAVTVTNPATTGLTLNYITIDNNTDHVEFSTDGSDFSYQPTDGGTGIDSSVTHIRFVPTGSMNASSSFTVTFKVRIQ